MTQVQRIAYGSEMLNELPNGDPLYLPRQSETCHDCGVDRGELHTPGCDVEQCPLCETQLISCDHWDEVMA